MGPDPLHSRLTNERLITRDFLALDRTYLAAERTLLAYVRTALACVLGGVGLVHLIDWPLATAVGWALVPAGLAILATGWRHWRRMIDHLDRVITTYGEGGGEG